MAITNGYTDTATFKHYFYELEGTDPLDEADYILEPVIEGASRVIDNMCDRRFYVASETRYFTADNSRLLFVDDYTGITTLKTDDNDDAVYENTWQTTDYHSLPLNAALDDHPYTHIEISSNGDYSFPKNVKGIELKATFGYSATAPDAIKHAVLIAAGQLYKRKDAVYGVAGTNALGILQVIQGELQKDAHFTTLLAPYVRMV
jgi:hypothetical protein